jgi:hypothetical protein
MHQIQLFAYEVATDSPAKLNTVLTEMKVELADLPEDKYFATLAGLQVTRIREDVLPNVRNGALPVFIAPEFFFRRSDGTPFQRSTFINGIDHLLDLSRSVPDVLWIVGTVWWHDPRKGSGEETVVHNSAMILHGGRMVRTWQKERLSSIDGLHDATRWDRENPDYAKILEDTQDPVFAVAVPGSGQTMTTGIEICLDHRTTHRGVGVLRTKYLAQNPSSGAGVDLHILAVAGMRIQPENVVARNGGYLIRCDGGRGVRPRSQCVRVNRDGANAAAALREWNPTLTAHQPSQYCGEDIDHRVAIYDPVTIV